MTKTKDICSAIALLALCGVLWYNLGDVPEKLAAYPHALLLLLGGLLLVLIAQSLFARKAHSDATQASAAQTEAGLPDGESEGAGTFGMPTLLVLGLSFLCLLAMPYIGFTIASGLLLVIMMLAMGVRNLWVLILVPVVEIGALLFVFEYLLAVLLPDTEALRMMLGW